MIFAIKRLFQIVSSKSVLKLVWNCKNISEFHNFVSLLLFKMSKSQSFLYPIAPKSKTVDNFHGTEITDLYRSLEDPDSEITKDYVEQQNKISQPFLEDCPEWKKFNEKITKLWNYPKYTCPWREGDNYYFFKNDGLQNQSVLFKLKNLNDPDPRVFLDPNQLSEDGTVALSTTAFSDDGKIFAYGLSESGSDWIKIKIKDVETDREYGEVLEKIKFSSIAWTHDNKGFFYSQYPDQDGKTDGSETQANENEKLFYHRIGDPQSNDTLCVEFPNEPIWRTDPIVSDCGKYLILNVVKDCRDNMVYYADLEKEGHITKNLTIYPIINEFEADYEYITNNGLNMIFRTNKDAPNYQLIVIDFNNPNKKHWKTLIKEHDTDVIDEVLCCAHNYLIISYMHDVKNVLKVFDLTSGNYIRDFPLDIGTVSLSGERKFTEIFFTFISFLNPGTIYRFDFANGIQSEPEVYRDIKLNLKKFEKEDYIVEQIFYKSRDNTKVPMFVIRKKTKEVQPRPCLLYGYGGFNVSLNPTFNITGLMFIDTFDGVLAYPNIRGGGEYGEKWHNSGRLLNKQNVFDDFQHAAKYLINNKYTTKNKLMIQGGSNGGLLVGACINQTPELFGAAVAQVGVMDMLRFHKFTIGIAWCSDYGNPSEKKEDFENLYKYSPLHNVHEPRNDIEEYPSTLLLTADHDDRVSPLHSLKFAAALQDAVRSSKFQNKPILLRVYTKAGHGAGKPTAKKIEEATDIMTFAFKSLEIDQVNL
ncbi:prolyl endopeptidase-like [Condylostylus longicornis]|uniref:prolyl endopeptidase-like n=1 Tax=Condylostylus longicornis TaxID=2530218 RepID=UPI00244DFA2A|nr:prolyl endopeptidase-like [Condylostylus longicornis]